MKDQCGKCAGPTLCTAVYLYMIDHCVQTRRTSVAGVLGPPVYWNVHVHYWSLCTDTKDQCGRCAGPTLCTCTWLITVYRHEGPVWQVCWAHLCTAVYLYITDHCVQTWRTSVAGVLGPPYVRQCPGVLWLRPQSHHLEGDQRVVGQAVWVLQPWLFRWVVHALSAVCGRRDPAGVLGVVGTGLCWTIQERYWWLAVTGVCTLDSEQKWHNNRIDVVSDLCFDNACVHFPSLPTWLTLMLRYWWGGGQLSPVCVLVVLPLPSWLQFMLWYW